MKIMKRQDKQRSKEENKKRWRNGERKDKEKKKYGIYLRAASNTESLNSRHRNVLCAGRTTEAETAGP